MRKSHKISKQTFIDKTITRIFRVVEMTIIMAVLHRFAGRVYPEETDWVVWVLGWMVSYYAIEDVIRVMIDAVADSTKIAKQSKIFWYFIVTILVSLFIWWLMRPFVVILATMPLIP